MRNLSAFQPNTAGGTTKAYYPLNGNLAGSLKDGLISSYRLEDVNDSFGSYTLTNTGSVPFNAGKINNGADFTPNDSLNNNSVLGATSYPRSFAGWAKFDTITGDDRTVFSLGDGAVHYYVLKVRDSDDHIVFRSNNTTLAADVDTGITASTGTWYHWAVVQNSSTSVTIYINNTATNTAATTFTATVSQFYLGYLGRSSVWWMDGIIDEVGIWNRVLTADEISRLYNAGNGMQLETRALDYSGNGNHGIETAITYPQGRFGQAARFNGSSSRIQAEDSASISLTGNYTISVWANPTALPGAGAFSSLVCKFDGTGNTGGYDLRLVESTGQKIGLVNGYSNTQDGGDVIYTLPLNKWSNIIGIYNGATVQIFVNGYSIGSVSCTNNPVDNTKKLNIGNFGYYTPTTNELGRYFNGLIDEVIIESRAWTAKEVETYYRKSALNYRQAGWITKLLQAFRITETATLSEVPSVLRQRLFSVSETATLTESITSALGKIFEIIESVSLSETFSAVRTFAFNVAESIGLTEVLARVRKKWSNVDKNTATFTNEDKNSSDWVNRIKN